MDKQSLIFSANSLQTYVDCARRFELNYLEGLVWPAVESEPVLRSEEFLENGRIFHEMIHRDLLGMPPINKQLEAPIAEWWTNYQTEQPAALEGQKFPEKTLVGNVGGQLLVATFDLIVITPENRAVIFDWKTWRYKKSEEKARKLLQSRVYPYLLIQAAHTLIPGLTLRPEMVEMRYWLAQHPNDTIAFTYSQEEFEADETYIVERIREILEANAGDFALTDDLKKCDYCVYRSYCGRGDVAGQFELEEAEDELDFTVELLGNLDDYESVAITM